MLTAARLFNWDSLAADYLEDFLDEAENFDVSTDAVMYEIIDSGGEITDLSSWYRTVIYLTFNSIMRGLEDYLNENYRDAAFYDKIISKIYDMKREFYPYINYEHSCYNNVLDNIYLLKDRNSVYEDIIHRLLSIIS